MRILIVEDELVIAQRLERFLILELAGTLTHLDRCATLDEAEKWLTQNPVDVVFLDLNLNGQDGFSLVKDIASRAFHTVVVSAHTERAIEAFEIGVLDFVGKPFSAERIHKTAERLHGARANQPAASLSIRSAGRIDLVPIPSIAFIKAAGSYSELVLRDGTVRVHSKSLDRLLTILPATFERIHRSYVVRLDEIAQIRVREGSRYAAVLDSGDELPIGRTRVETLKTRLGMG